MSRFSITDAYRLAFRIVHALEEGNAAPSGERRTWERPDKTKYDVYKDNEGNWRDAETHDIVRPARKSAKDADAGGKRGKAKVQEPQLEPEPAPEPVSEPEPAPEGGAPKKKKKKEYAPNPIDLTISTRKAKSPDECKAGEYFAPAGKNKTPHCVSGVQVAKDIDEFIKYAKEGEDQKVWYKNAKAAVDEVFQEDAPRFLAILASTSANMPLNRNVRMATDIYRAWAAGEYPDGVSQNTMNTISKMSGGRMRKDVEAALRGDFHEIDEVKVGEFKKNLFGDEVAITVDRHMYNMFYGVDVDVSKHEDEYREFIKRTVRDIADRLGWTNAETQAAMWVFYLRSQREEEFKNRGVQTKRKTVPKTVYETYDQVFSEVQSQIDNIRELLIKKREASAGGESPGANESRTVWHPGRLLMEGDGMGKSSGKMTSDQLAILDNLIAILKYQSDAYGNARKLVKGIQKAKDSGEIDDFMKRVSSAAKEKERKKMPGRTVSMDDEGDADEA